MTAPTREQREEWRRQIGQPQPPAGLDPVDYDYPEIIQVLLDALDAAEEREAEIAATALTVERERDEALERLAAVRLYVDDAAIVDGPDGFDNDPRLLAWIDLDRIRKVLTGDDR